MNIKIIKTDSWGKNDGLWAIGTIQKVRCLNEDGTVDIDVRYNNSFQFVAIMQKDEYEIVS